MGQGYVMGEWEEDSHLRSMGHWSTGAAAQKRKSRLGGSGKRGEL